MEYFIIGLISLIVGFLLGVLVTKKAGSPTIGTLKIDTSGDQKDVYRFEVDKVPLADLPNYKSVSLDVESINSPKEHLL